MFSIIQRRMFVNSFVLFVFIGTCSISNLLAIENNDNEDQVEITGLVVNQTTSTVSAKKNLFSLKWTKSLKNLTENAGKTVLLECQVESSHPVKFNWYRYNNLLDQNRFKVDRAGFRSSLLIKHLKESQAGFYTCEVSNEYKTLISTGFVRVQNLEIEPIDISDDALPPIELSPISFGKADDSIEKLRCEIYSGKICRPILGSAFVSTTNIKQKEIEENFFEHLKIFSSECRQFLLPLICLFIYPICDHQQRHVRSVCRQSCFYFEAHPCAKGISSNYPLKDSLSTFQSMHHIPTCQNLPPASDDHSCIQIDPFQNVSSKRPSTSKNQESSNFSSIWNVFLTICLPIAGVFLLLLFCCCYYRYQRSKKKAFVKAPATNSFSQRLTSYPTSPFHSVPNQPLIVHSIVPSSSSSTHTHLTHLPSHQHFHNDNRHPGQISSENIRFLYEIGQGDFGRVYLGEIIESRQKCLIKTLQTEKATDEYLREIEIFRQIHHVHISCLIGVCIESQNAFSFMIYEYLNKGDLHSYVVEKSETLKQRDFIRISIQIASGMIYLSEKKIHHNDLALRNVLISEHQTIKITNIARCCPKFYLDYYKIANRLLPVRWMSIEALLSGVNSETSDVWSFGVLLWEMFSFGIQPYFGYTNPEVFERVRDRKLLLCPTHCPRKIFLLMTSCWNENNKQRPSFVEIFEILKSWDEKINSPPMTQDERLMNYEIQAPIARTETPLIGAERIQ